MQNETTSDPTGGPYFEVQAALVALIEDHLSANQSNGRKMSQKAFAKSCGLGESKIYGILSGHKKASGMDKLSLEGLANVLQISLLQLYTMCGQIKTEDFFYEHDAHGASETLDRIYRTMQADAFFCFRVPTPAVWGAWPTRAKVHVALMYQNTISNKLKRYL